MLSPESDDRSSVTFAFWLSPALTAPLSSIQCYQLSLSSLSVLKQFLITSHKESSKHFFPSSAWVHSMHGNNKPRYACRELTCKLSPSSFRFSFFSFFVFSPSFFSFRSFLSFVFSFLLSVFASGPADGTSRNESFFWDSTCKQAKKMKRWTRHPKRSPTAKSYTATEHWRYTVIVTLSV